ncbi:glutamine--fructose-6-phosphate transaminase (isomerizing) [Aestuariirhabdus litorea]|uniref:Glutamine--fructose-6-phosphate aminotransferase [isomerizing] n=1 Tax=Aestuariirhabdus litorea TaxID=2528527 RepID=A0A3P3VLM5_9GAMM|nr:glutamine--fructose-6-phosphate transaminase (isomerizing) [Aestuariirhabdus litorea]RRJ82629.1 glutamine--fructose-6-phosphate transaminase (isomerizing) [Aestuariirhabdus litorea]RWW92789.1 glutamine--fructose-6-phosphate transaminase (isomerizing) [Endozoicomonadaceae bacterium GTF-13]
MCGIVGAVAQRDVADILLEGLKRLEYRGYDSAGVAIVDGQGNMQRVRRLGKVSELAEALLAHPLSGGSGIAHTRWATHGVPSENNAHPHVSCGDLAIVHNGIIENHEVLRDELSRDGYKFTSETDTEVMAHLIHRELSKNEDLLSSVLAAVNQLEGAYGTVVMDRRDPSRLVAARSGSPLVVGLGIGENFLASDQLALLPVTRRFLFLEEGDVCEMTRTKVDIYDRSGTRVERRVIESDLDHDAGDKGQYRHYMLKEIHEQPSAVRNTLEDRLTDRRVIIESFGEKAADIFSKVKNVQIIACGTSYHAGMVARYWFESVAGVQCNVEIASEFRYRKSFVPDNSLFVTISQSGETADTLAALRLAKESGYMASLTLCNVPGSSLVRESDLAFMTRAGAEIGVASTKAFTTQLVSLLMLVAAIGRYNDLSEESEAKLVKSLRSLPSVIESALCLSDDIETMAEAFSDKHHSLFLGRGSQYPIAMEGALKLKEISYIHAEAYAAGELKHGPLALIDNSMPVVVVAPNNELLEKLKSNMEEVRARGGLLYVFADSDARLMQGNNVEVLTLNRVDDLIAPIVYTIPLQLLSYFVAIIKGTDVDQPRNLAKSVTVE